MPDKINKTKEWKKKELKYKKEIEMLIIEVKNLEANHSDLWMVNQGLKREIERWIQQFEQAKMIIDDIKKITDCKSDDGVEIIESVEHLEQQLQYQRKRIEDRIEKLEKECKDEIEQLLKLNPNCSASYFVLNRTKVEIIRELKNLLGAEKDVGGNRGLEGSTIKDTKLPSETPKTIDDIYCKYQIIAGSKLIKLDDMKQFLKEKIEPIIQEVKQEMLGANANPILVDRTIARELRPFLNKQLLGDENL